MPAQHFHPACAIVALVCVGLGACRGESADDIVSKPSVLAEGSAQGTLYWDVDPNGDTRVVVKDEKGTVVRQGVTGQLAFTTKSEPKAQTVDLKVDEDTGVARADGPDLEGLTQMKYTLIVNGKPRTGVLHLPETGTKGLVETATRNVAPSEVAGPHGGTIQIVGEQRYEVVANAESREMRAYVLGQVDVKPKKLKLAIDAERSGIVEAKWHADGYYWARLGVRSPRKVSLVIVDHDDDVHIVLLGLRPGVVVKLDAHPVFWVRRDWDHHPGLARGHYKGDPVRGPPGQSRYARPSKVMIKSKDQGKGGRAKVTVKAH